MPLERAIAGKALPVSGKILPLAAANAALLELAQGLHVTSGNGRDHMFWLSLLLATQSLHPLEDLRAQITQFSGATALIDPRLTLPYCDAPQLAWLGPSRGAVSVTCAAPVWRIFVPVQGAALAPVALPVVRRGDHVTVNASGQGYSVAVEGVAESDAAIGAALRIRNRVTGAHINAQLGQDGVIRVARSGF